MVKVLKLFERIVIMMFERIVIMIRLVQQSDMLEVCEHDDILGWLESFLLMVCSSCSWGIVMRLLSFSAW